MKLFSKILIVSFSLLLVQCKQQPVKNPLYEKIVDIIHTQSNNTVFDLITDYSSLDSEVDVIIASKKRIDAARLDLIRSVDISALIDENSSEQEQKKMFSDRILTLYKFHKLIKEAQDSFKSHIVLILAQLGNSDSEYEQAKAVLSSTDNEFEKVATTVLESLTDYDEKSGWYAGKLQSLLEMVEDLKFEEALNTLESDEMCEYYISVAKMLNTLYAFEVYRAELILKAAKKVF